MGVVGMNPQSRSLIIAIAAVVCLCLASVSIAYGLYLCRPPPPLDTTVTMPPFTSLLPFPFPRVIYTYWDNPATVPRVVRTCIASWKRHNPGWKIVLLHRNTAGEYAPELQELLRLPCFKDMVQRTSDVVRSCVLARLGGFWVDSSVFMRAPLESWLAAGLAPETEFVAFYIEAMTKALPAIENWFFGCAVGSAFMAKWRDEFLKLRDFESVGDYLQAVRASGVDISGISIPNYLTMHVAATKVLADGYPLDRLKLYPAEKGPLLALAQNNWKVDDAMRAECATPPDRRGPLLKLRGADRDLLEQDPELAACVLSPKCSTAWVRPSSVAFSSAPQRTAVAPQPSCSPTSPTMAPIFA